MTLAKLDLSICSLVSCLLGCTGTMTTTPGTDDGGEVATDAGATRRDAGFDLDAGSPVDAGPGIDAGGPPMRPPPLPSGEAGWERLEGTALAPHCADVGGAFGCRGITEAWSGGAYDARRDRLIITGGGHNDYYGNELYALDVRTPAMARITEPGRPTAPSSPCEEAIAGGSEPNSRHTYDGIEYLEHADALYVFSGSLACGSGNFGQVTWTYDFTNTRWQRRDPSGDRPLGEAGMLTAYDPVTGLLFLRDRFHLYAYDVDRDTYRRVSSEREIGYHHTAALDPDRRLFVFAGWSSYEDRGMVYVYDVSAVDSGGMARLRTLDTSGGDAIVDRVYPGLAYDPVARRLVAWAGGGTVYTLDVDAETWTPHSYTGGPGAALDNGTMGRFQYAPGVDAFVVYNAIDDDGYLFRFPRE